MKSKKENNDIDFTGLSITESMFDSFRLVDRFYEWVRNDQPFGVDKQYLEKKMIESRYNKDGVTLYWADCRILLSYFGLACADAVITDPPYLEGDFSSMLPEFERVANRIVLTPGKLESFNWIARKKPFWEYCWRMSSKSLGGSACLHIGWEPILAYAPPIKPLGNDVLTFTQKTSRGMKGIHKWPKPLDLFRFLVQRWTYEDDTVLDPFMGSGTTGVACVQLGRRFIGIEIDEKYYQIAEKRIREAQMQLRLPL